MIDTEKYEGLTIDDWYKMNHHDWKDVVNEHNDLLAEVKRLREALLLIADTANGRPFVDGHIGLPLVHEVLKELIDE